MKTRYRDMKRRFRQEVNEFVLAWWQMQFWVVSYNLQLVALIRRKEKKILKKEVLITGFYILYHKLHFADPSWNSPLYSIYWHSWPTFGSHTETIYCKINQEHVQCIHTRCFKMGTETTWCHSSMSLGSGGTNHAGGLNPKIVSFEIGGCWTCWQHKKAPQKQLL